MKVLVLAAVCAASAVATADASTKWEDADPHSSLSSALVDTANTPDLLATGDFWAGSGPTGSKEEFATFAQYSNRGWDWGLDCDFPMGRDCDWEWDGDWDWENLPPWWWWGDKPEFPDFPGRPPEISPPPAPVPLPPTFLALAAGLAGIGYVGRRRKKQQK